MPPSYVLPLVCNKMHFIQMNAFYKLRFCNKAVFDIVINIFVFIKAFAPFTFSGGGVKTPNHNWFKWKLHTEGRPNESSVECRAKRLLLWLSFVLIKEHGILPFFKEVKSASHRITSLSLLYVISKKQRRSDNYIVISTHSDERLTFCNPPYTLNCYHSVIGAGYDDITVFVHPHNLPTNTSVCGLSCLGTTS
jgi:hypothetical protein